MAVEVALGTPLADALQNVVTPKLVEAGWSTGAADDSALSEYIILMLVNGKTQEQLASELSNDLLGLGPEDPGPIDFSRWLFEQVEILDRQLNNKADTQAAVPTGPKNFQPQPAQPSTIQDGQIPRGSASSVQDTEMGDVGEGSQAAVVPTAPKSMRNGNERVRDKRMLGQLNKALDRTSDAALHRVRGTAGTGRISSHATREPPKGPRNAGSRNPAMTNGRTVGAMPMPNMQNRLPITPTTPANAFMTMTPQQQMQLFAMYEEQARMMAQILSPQQQSQMFGNPVAGPIMNSGTQNGHVQQQQQQPPGRSLFERVEGKRSRLQNSHGRRQPQQDGFAPSGNSAVQFTQGQDPSSSMEVESSQQDPSQTMCRYNLTCTKPDCPFVHQSPAAPPGIAVDMTDECSFGAACKNHKCVGRHPSPAKKTAHQSEVDCKFFPNCTNPQCPFRHPSMPPCRNGADCSVPNCKFSHTKIVCRYNPCKNPACPFKHTEGQRRGTYEDKVWISEYGEKEHVSDRKFVDEDHGEEELILPGKSSSDSAGATAITA